MKVNYLVISKLPPIICINFICVSSIKLCINAEQNKKKERNHPCTLAYNLVREIRNIQTDNNIWTIYSLSNVHSQSTEEAKTSVGYSSQIQIHEGSSYLK